MTVGPVDVVVVEFKGNHFKGDILDDVSELVEGGVIRIIDAVIVTKDEAGAVGSIELGEVGPDVVVAIDRLQPLVSQLITQLDIQAIGEQLTPNSTAGILMFENLWAKKTQQAVFDAGGRLVAIERIPHAVMEEALAELAAMGAPDLNL